MILDARKTKLRGIFIDMDTGKPIPRVQYANMFTGDYVTAHRDLTGKAVFVSGHARLKFIEGAILGHKSAHQAQLAPPGPPVDGAGNSAACGNGCAGRRPPAGRVGEEHDCQAYGCIHKAEWMTAHEVSLPPQEVVEMLPPIVAGDGTVLVPSKKVVRMFDRGKVVQTSYWCHRHYTPPQTVFPDGSSDPIEVNKGRPQ